VEGRQLFITKMPRKRSKQQIAEDEAESFRRQTICIFCYPHTEKESFEFQGQTIYYCPEHSDFGRYRDLTYGGYWRRNGEQTQN
jgi:hypothetical protein